MVYNLQVLTVGVLEVDSYSFNLQPLESNSFKVLWMLVISDIEDKFSGDALAAGSSTLNPRPAQYNN